MDEIGTVPTYLGSLCASCGCVLDAGVHSSAAQYSVILIRNIVLSSVSERERAARHARHQA